MSSVKALSSSGSLLDERLTETGFTKTQISIFVVEKVYVSAAGIVFLILTGFLRAGYNELKVEHQMDLDIFQFEFHGTGFLGRY